MPGPLAGIKVIEMAGLGPCPLAGQLLGDLGADVILVDRKSGDADPTDINRRSKRSIAMNLKDPEAVKLLLDILSDADILIEGFRPGVMEKLGLGPKVCAAKNPRLIYGRMTGWGQDGPLSQTAGHDINYLALTGTLHAIGEKNSPPIPPLNMVADYAGGTMFLLLGVLSALLESKQSGRGQVVDTAMVDCVPLLTSLMHMFLAKDQWTNTRKDNLLDGGSPFYRCYETKDKKYISVGSLEPQFFAELVQLANLPADDALSQYDKQSWPERHKAYEQIFHSKTRQEWETIFSGSDACVAPVLDWSEMAKHPHNQARNIFFENCGVLQASPAPRFERTVTDAISPPAAQGANTDEILENAGCTPAQIQHLRETGALT